MVTIEKKIAWLLEYDFAVGKRDPRVKPGEPGEFMVADFYDAGDEDCAGWAIVGDDLNDLVERAYDKWVWESVQ